jgi:hypothetical protein
LKKRAAVFLCIFGMGCGTQSPVGPTRTIVDSDTHAALPPPPTAAFNVHPMAGPFPLTVHFNMCGSSDTAPWVDLKYKVDFGDGSEDQGFCRFTHVYTQAAQYHATACVSDRIASHAPVCKTFEIGAFCELDLITTSAWVNRGGFCVGEVSVAPGSCNTHTAHLAAGGQTFDFPIPSKLFGFLPTNLATKFTPVGNEFGGITYVQPDARCDMIFHTVAP